MKKSLSAILASLRVDFSKKDRAAALPEDPDEVGFVVLDTETTGLDPARDRILSIGALRLRGGRISVNECLELYLEQEHFDHRSVPIHGILREGHTHRFGEKEALQRLLIFMGDAVLVGHHIGFDLAILKHASYRHGLGDIDNLSVDTNALFRRAQLQSPLVKKKESYSLDELALKFSLSLEDRHTALGDACLTALVFLHVQHMLKNRNTWNTRQLLKFGK